MCVDVSQQQQHWSARAKISSFRARSSVPGSERFLAYSRPPQLCLSSLPNCWFLHSIICPFSFLARNHWSPRLDYNGGQRETKEKEEDEQTQTQKAPPSRSEVWKVREGLRFWPWRFLHNGGFREFILPVATIIHLLLSLAAFFFLSQYFIKLSNNSEPRMLLNGLWSNSEVVSVRQR